MGKGKKKDKGAKKEEIPISTLSISEPGPSTSQTTVEEVEEGLTGGGRHRKKKQKNVKDDTSTDMNTGDAIALKVAGSEPTAKIQPEALAGVVSESGDHSKIQTESVAVSGKGKQETDPAKEEDTEGLGLGGPRKRAPRKKKGAKTDTTEPATSKPIIVPTTGQQSGIQGQDPTFQSPGFPSQAPQLTGTGYGQPFTGPSPAAGYSQQGPLPEAGWSQSLPSLVPGAGRGQQLPTPSPGAGRGQQLPTSLPGAGRGQRLPTPSPGAGRGQQLPTPSPGAGRGQQLPIPSPGAGRGQQLPRPSPGAGAASFQTQILQPSQSVQSTSLYKIPSKILGKSVRMRPIDVLTNYLPMTIKALKIPRYDVSFNPDRPKKKIPEIWKIVKNKHFPNEILAFDQVKNCYSLRNLPNISTHEKFTTEVAVKDDNEKVMQFTVSMKFTGIVDLGTILSYMASGSSLNVPAEAIQCIDVILRQGTLDIYKKAGRQFFKRPSNPIYLGDGLEMWTGLFQSAIFTSSAFVNVDVAHKGFPVHQPLLKAIQDSFRLELNRSMADQRGRAMPFLEFIKGLRVIASFVGPNREKREFLCNELVKPADVQDFVMTNPQGRDIRITVANYFKQFKGYTIKYPKLECMWLGPKDKNIFYPMELLEVSYGQVRNRQLNEIQLSTMVREAATPPDVRKRKIEEVITNMNYSGNRDFKAFGLDIGKDFITVKAKILEPPKLSIGGRRVTEIPRRGAWNADSLLKPSALASWGFIAVECDPRSCDFTAIINMIMTVGRQLGMDVANPKLTRFQERITIKDVQQILETALVNNINFLFIVISSRGRDYYHKIKQYAERDVGILTQCIKEFTATKRMNPATVKNILLKVNSKLMGINQALDNASMPRCLLEGKVMVVGADVTHPSPDQSNVPSIAAVTASIDPKCYIYNIEMSIQTPKREMIVQMEDMMVDHFQLFKKRSGSLPHKIYVFRDGVSEGQFGEVMKSELAAVHRAYRRLSGNEAKPEILFLLVQKRHHTRFFQPGNNIKYNVEPGTVVDTTIVHARELDFYLVSHQAIKGTARPTRYHAVCNDGGIPSDEVEQLTYYLCHLYSRCMRAVSYPTPTYYAHLACTRAKSLTYDTRFDNKALEKEPQRLRVLDKMLQHSRMFFV